MYRTRKYFCQSQAFYQRDQLLSRILKDSEDSFRSLDQHGKSVQKQTRDMFIKFTQAKIAEQKKLIETDSVGVFQMFLELIENVSHDKMLMAYVLTSLDAIISENQRQFKQFMRAITPQIVPKLKSFLFLDGYEPVVYESAAKIATMIIAEGDTTETKEAAKEWVVLFIGGVGQRDSSDRNKLKIADFMIMPICVYMLKHEYLAIQFLKSGGIKIITYLLGKYSTDLQICYYTILGLWLLSYCQESQAFFNDPIYGLIRLTIEAIQKISREKILRVAFACFRNLADVSASAIEQMVDYGLIKVVDLLLKGNLKDQDVIDDIKHVGEILEKNMKILTSFEKYLKELNAQSLTWSPVHTEKFWRENVKKFEENDFLMIRKLAEILTSENSVNVAVSCYDLGEFCRFHPFGKVVLDQLNAKQQIMKWARSDDQMIRENALLALQKIMLHNWQEQLDVTAMMEELYEKLTLLAYDAYFVKQKGGKPLNASYFSVQGNQSEQFNYFKALVKWLFHLNEVQTSDFNKLDDPLTLAQNIINELKNISLEADFPPIKLKQGFGEHIVHVLLQLATRALKVKKFQFKKAKFEQPSQTHEEEAVQETGSVSSDSDPEVASDEEPEDMVNEQGFQKDEEKMVIEAKVDPKEWQMEVERASQKLKIQLKADAREWRNHFEQTKQYSQQIKQVLPEARLKLERMSEELSEVLDRISKRENQINDSMGEQVKDYKKKNDEFKVIELQYKNYTNAIKEMSEQFRQTDEKYQQIQTKLNEHGNVSTDQSPVIKIKASLTKLKLEIKQMDLRIGVLSHTILQRTFQDSKAMQEREFNDNGLILNETDELSD